MLRKLKLLGLATVAFIALAALAASEASAFQEFQSETTDVALKGTATDTQKIRAAGGTLECTEYEFEGMSTGKSVASYVVIPRFSTCTFLGQTATINKKSCEFLYNATGKFAITGVLCSGFTFENSECKVEMPSQGFAGGKVNYTNKETGKESQILIGAAVTGLEYEATGKCPKTGKRTDGELEGSTTMTGETKTDSKVMVGIVAV